MKVRNPGRRGGFLAVVGILHMLIGFALIAVPEEQRPALNRALHVATVVAPLWVFGIAWAVTGAAAVLDGLFGRSNVFGFTVGVLMPAAWSLVQLGSWVDGDQPRGWVNFALFATLSAAITIVAGMPDSTMLGQVDEP